MTRLPDGWEWVSLGVVADTALGKMLDRGRSRGLPQVPYLRNVNVQWGRIDTDDLLAMELGDDERARFGVATGDLLVCEGGEIGRCAIWLGSNDYIAYQKACTEFAQEIASTRSTCAISLNITSRQACSRLMPQGQPSNTCLSSSCGDSLFLCHQSRSSGASWRSSKTISPVWTQAFADW